MKTGWYKKGIMLSSAAILAVSMSACGSNVKTSGVSEAPKESTSTTATEPAVKDVTLKFFSNTPDRTSGMGLLEQKLMDQYVSENPNIKIELETASEPYGDKLKMYNASNKLPDVFVTWGDAAFMEPMINNNALAELDINDYKSQDFIPGSLEKFTKKGKLFGIPKNSDFWVVMYNKKIFADNGLEIPTTLDELNNVSAKLKAKNIVPIALAGKEQWEAGITFDLFLQRAAGTFDVAKKGLDRTGSFNDPAVIEAAKNFQAMTKNGYFGTGFINNDYNTAKNMFAQGKAAMFLIGEWEMGLATDTKIPEESRKEFGAFAFPGSEKAKSTDTAMWFGAGYSISKNSKHLEESKAFLKWLFKPENWAKNAWQTGTAIPTQKYDQFFTGKENELQKDLTNIFSKATTTSDIIQNALLGEQQKEYYDALQKLLAAASTPEQFQKSLEDAAIKNVEKK